LATIYDIAKAAGVTATTVSYVLSGKGSISAATRERVLQYAQELGYRPNLIARSLIKQETHTIGLVIPHITNPFYAEIAEILERRAYAAGFRTFITNTYEDERFGKELLDDLASRRVDGIIALPGGIALQALESMNASGLLVVCCLWEEEEKQTISPSIEFDFLTGGQLVARHLLESGHRRIGLIVDGIPDGRVDHHLRFSGCLQVLAEAGIPLEPDLLQWGDSSLQSGKLAAERLLALPEPPTAIFATNDQMAIGAINAAWQCGLALPRDLSVVGFDDILMAPFTAPPLTTISIDKDALISSAMSVLMSMIEGKPVTLPAPLAPNLMVRESTAPPRARGDGP